MTNSKPSKPSNNNTSLLRQAALPTLLLPNPLPLISKHTSTIRLLQVAYSNSMRLLLNSSSSNTSPHPAAHRNTSSLRPSNLKFRSSR